MHVISENYITLLVILSSKYLQIFKIVMGWVISVQTSHAWTLILGIKSVCDSVLILIKLYIETGRVYVQKGTEIKGNKK